MMWRIVTLGRQLQVLDLIESEQTAEHRLARFDGRFWAVHRQATRARVPPAFAELARKLKHEHIATVLASGTDATELPYVVEEYALGLSLREILSTRKSLGPMEATRVVRAVCLGVGRIVDACRGADVALPDALSLAHTMVRFDGKIKVGDPFRHLRGADSLDPAYAAPEQLSGRDAGVTSMVFQLGIVLWELIAASPREALQGPCAVSPLAERVPSFPPKLDDILRCACSNAASERFDSLEALANALGTVSERTTSELASCMQSLFANQHAMLRDWLTEAHQGVSIPPLVPSKAPDAMLETSSLQSQQTPLATETVETLAIDKTQPVKLALPKHMQPRPQLDGRYRTFADERPFLDETERAAAESFQRSPMPSSAGMDDEAPTKPFTRAIPDDKTEETPFVSPADLESTATDTVETAYPENLNGASAFSTTHEPPISLAPAAEPAASVIVSPQTPAYGVRSALPLHVAPEIRPDEPTVHVQRVRGFQLQDAMLVFVTVAFLGFAFYTVFLSKDDPQVARPSTRDIPFAYPTDVPRVVPTQSQEVPSAAPTEAEVVPPADLQAVPTPATTD
jgi:serine/threonine protein kinase